MLPFEEQARNIAKNKADYEKRIQDQSNICDKHLTSSDKLTEDRYKIEDSINKAVGDYDVKKSIFCINNC